MVGIIAKWYHIPPPTNWMEEKFTPDGHQPGYRKTHCIGSMPDGKALSMVYMSHVNCIIQTYNDLVPSCENTQLTLARVASTHIHIHALKDTHSSRITSTLVCGMAKALNMQGKRVRL